jgi:acetyltransferase-like isoleucine patch superfamily enzyme
MLPGIKAMILKLRNCLQCSGNVCQLGRIHCQGNRITLKGRQTELRCDPSSVLRDSTIYLDGNQISLMIGEGASLYGEGANTAYICGNDNRIIIGKGCVLRKVSFFIRGSGNTIVIGDHCSAYNVQFHVEQNGNEIVVGDGTTFHGRGGQAIHMAADEGSRIQIGKDCMFAHSTQIRSTDSHSIVNLEGMRVNPAKDVIIGDHCWIGLQCVILKGTEIPPHCVAAAGAVCSKKFTETNCVIAGNPAKVVKREIDWDRKFVQ